jgi:hypothetical protein
MHFPESGVTVVVLSNVIESDASQATTTAVAMARRVLDTTYDGYPAYVEIDSTSDRPSDGRSPNRK